MDTLQPRLIPGDIVFTHGERWVSRLIRWVTRSKGERRAWASHVGLVSYSGTLNVPANKSTLPWVIEAVVPRVIERPWKPSGPVAVARPRNLSWEVQRNVVEAARDYVGDSYTQTTLLIHFLRLDRLLAKFFGNRWRICSWVVGVAYGSQGFYFGQESEALDPEEIFDFVDEETRQLAGKYKWVIPPE